MTFEISELHIVRSDAVTDDGPRIEGRRFFTPSLKLDDENIPFWIGKHLLQQKKTCCNHHVSWPRCGKVKFAS